MIGIARFSCTRHFSVSRRKKTLAESEVQQRKAQPKKSRALQRVLQRCRAINVGREKRADIGRQLQVRKILLFLRKARKEVAVHHQLFVTLLYIRATVSNSQSLLMRLKIRNVTIVCARQKKRYGVEDGEVFTVYSLGMRFMARNGRSTRTVRIADKFILPVSSTYSKPLQPPT